MSQEFDDLFSSRLRKDEVSPDTRPPRKTPAPLTRLPKGFESEPVNLATFPANKDGGDGKAITVQAAQQLIEWARPQGLNPWFGHCIYYYGRPYITELGSIALVRGKTSYHGYDCSPERPDLPDTPQVPDGSTIWRCTVYLGPKSKPIVDWGVVTPEEIAEAQKRYGERAHYLPLVSRTWTVAKARAIRRAHLRAAQAYLPDLQPLDGLSAVG